ncbi:AraC family transcriptional regulator [Marinomonas ostreistagni]|uniref:Helix-turn-helix transcriptional regulator n=1 Tax=Marinomonas ostreistagni TaxID=359209 RepID=A0ABS0ZDZ5_9GAMM|nr:helix-turn-helix transcriptional regulator [Marinomonas ostreistagni]MBJ7551598.1 helix-turn-helix transcriptional regulator [Marinomonas ostreistagni]
MDTRVVSSIEERSLQPSQLMPIRAISRHMTTTTKVISHHHHWAQVVFSNTGVVKVSSTNGIHIVPPRHAVWIPPNVEHAATLLENAQLLSVYIDVSIKHLANWHQCQVFKVSSLLHELVVALGLLHGHEKTPRYHALCEVICSEFEHLKALSIGIVMPKERRLKAICEAFLEAPKQATTLKYLCSRSGASLSTATRLFDKHLGMNFNQWRQQVLLSQAVALAAQKMPIQQIAYELGYTSPSAFTAMVTNAVGIPPKQFLYQQTDR